MTNYNFKVLNAQDLKMPRVHVFLYGNTGSGKTLSASTFPNPFFVVPKNEQSIVTLRGRSIQYVEIDKRADLDDVLRYLEDTQRVSGPDGLPGETLVIESLSHYIDLVVEEISASNKSGKMDQQGWGLVASHFRNMQARLRRLDMHVVFTALAEALVDNDGKQSGGRPLMTGSTRLKLPSACDIIAYMAVQDGKPPIYNAHFVQYMGYQARTRFPLIPGKIQNFTYDKIQQYLEDTSSAVPLNRAGDSGDSGEEQHEDAVEAS